MEAAGYQVQAERSRDGSFPLPVWVCGMNWQRHPNFVPRWHAAAYPDRPIICFEGDGAFQINGMNEMITVKRYLDRLGRGAPALIFCSTTRI